MWKKFLAALSVLTVFTTASAYALDVPAFPGNGGGTPSYIDNYTVAPATFNPKNGESVSVNFTLNADASLYVYAIDKDDFSVYEIVGTGIAPVPATQGSKTYTWNGKTAAGAVLGDGVYTVKTFAYATGTTNIVDFDFKDVTITSTTQPPQPPVDPSKLQVTKLAVDPKEFAASGAESTQVSFEVTQDAYVKVDIKNESNTVVKTISGYKGEKFYTSGEKHSVTWNGKNEEGEVVANGTYTVVVGVAKNPVDANGVFTAEATANETVKVTSGCPVNSTIIKNFCIDPSKNWDPADGEELEIEFELQKDVSSLRIDAVREENGKTVESIEIVDDDDADDGDYTETWDGTDDDGDYVDEGTWNIVVRADNDKVQLPVEVDYDQPDIIEAFVTKQSFDPSEDEITNLVFKVNVKADVTVDIYKGNKKEMNLFKDEEVKKNKWYAVQWDGKDEDGEDVDFGSDWQFKIKAENLTDQSIESLETVEVDVEEDDVSDKKTNVTNDYTVPVIFDEDDGYYSVQLSYVLDDEADVFVAVYEGMSSTGKEKVELLDYVEQTAGYHTIDWNVTDKNGKALKDGIYTYKVISRTGSGQKDTEVGRFVVGNAGDFTQPKPPTPPQPDETECNDGIDNDGDGYADYYGTYYYGADPGCESAEDNDEYNDFYPPWPPLPESSCGGYTDTAKIAVNNWEMCQAIQWVTDMGIFNGYKDGSFGTYNNINRAEVLKVVLEAFPGAFILPKDGSDQGFPDVDSDAWYMPYVRTAKFYGIMTGYPDGEAKLDRNINRVEFLKFVLISAEEFAGYSIPKYSYTGFKDVDFTDPKQQWFKDFAGVAWSMYLFDTEYDYESGKAYLRPADYVQRGEVALVLYKLYMNGVLGYDQPEYDMYGYPMVPTPYPYY